MSLRKPSEINPTLKCLSDPNNPKCETKEEPQPGNTAILNQHMLILHEPEFSSSNATNMITTSETLPS